MQQTEWKDFVNWTGSLEALESHFAATTYFQFFRSENVTLIKTKTAQFF